MFRGQSKSNKDPAHFGLGSIIKGTGSEKFLLVGYDLNLVGLVDLDTFRFQGKSVSVEDNNFLSEEETRNLVKVCLPWAFSDYSFDPKGLK